MGSRGPVVDDGLLLSGGLLPLDSGQPNGSIICRGIRTTRLTCSGVRGFVGKEPEWEARGGVDGRSAMMEDVRAKIGVFGSQVLSLPN